MLSNIVPSSDVAIAILIVSLILVFAFEATNGFHDTANAVATVIYTNSLAPTPAVIWSGIMNFIGVLVGGIAVAYAPRKTKFCPRRTVARCRCFISQCSRQ